MMLIICFYIFALLLLFPLRIDTCLKTITVEDLTSGYYATVTPWRVENGTTIYSRAICPDPSPLFWEGQPEPGDADDTLIFSCSRVLLPCPSYVSPSFRRRTSIEVTFDSGVKFTQDVDNETTDFGSYGKEESFTMVCTQSGLWEVRIEVAGYGLVSGTVSKPDSIVCIQN